LNSSLEFQLLLLMVGSCPIDSAYAICFWTIYKKYVCEYYGFNRVVNANCQKCLRHD
jgi:hypothetical protein